MKGSQTVSSHDGHMNPKPVNNNSGDNRPAKRSQRNPTQWIGSSLLLLFVMLAGVGLATWKYTTVQDQAAASMNQPEPREAVLIAAANEIAYRPTTTSIGTILALRSITLRNELPGTVRLVRLVPGQVVDPGKVLVALDVAVEEADLKAQVAEALLAKMVLERRQHLRRDLATSQEEVDRALADLKIVLAKMARTKAIIARKTIRAPFRAKVGLTDIHPGQYLNEGTPLTTLQSLDDSVHVDFMIPQQVAAHLREGDSVEVLTASESSPLDATITAVDARIDPTTRNAMVRARLKPPGTPPAPGASVRVRIPTGPPRKAVTIPTSALRKSPEGNHIYVIEPDSTGQMRAYVRRVESEDMHDDAVVIISGLSPGEQVATSGSFKLRDGVLITKGEDWETRRR
jgi:membrane fusion protein, multidrug efflux system